MSWRKIEKLFVRKADTRFLGVCTALFGVDLRLDAADQHAYGNGIETSLRDDYVGVFLRRLDELLVHGLDCRGAPPLAYVAQDAAGEADVGVRIDIYLDIHQVPEFLVLEDQNTIDDDYLRRFDQHGFGRSVVIDERIDRMFDRNVVFQRADVLDEHIRIERLRVVVIENCGYRFKDAYSQKS